MALMVNPVKPSVAFEVEDDPSPPVVLLLVDVSAFAITFLLLWWVLLFGAAC
jgi:hypothetical protein